MSENRFWFVIDKGKLEYVQDNVTGEMISTNECVDLLNEQQSIIRRDEMSIKTMMSNMKKLEEEKVELMEDCACQYKQIQKLESENEDLREVNKETVKYSLGETKPYYCKGDYIWSDGNGNITSKSRINGGLCLSIQANPKIRIRK